MPLSDQQAQGVPPASAHAYPGTIAGGAILAHGQLSGDDGATGREGERDNAVGDLGACNLTERALRRSGAAVSHRNTMRLPCTILAHGSASRTGRPGD